MLRSGTPRTGTSDEARGQQSLGELVSLALKDVSQLVSYEISLAKREFKVDLTRAIIGVAAFTLVLLVVYPIIIMLLFAYAYALHGHTVGLPLYQAFLVAAGTVLLFMIIAGVIGLAFFKKITGMKLTRKTVTEDIATLKKAMSSGGAVSGGEAVSAGTDLPALTEGVDDRDPAALTARALSG